LRSPAGGFSSTSREKPALLLLHGGPGFDHALYKPALSALAGVAQVIYLDHRGNGRSSGEDKATCKLAQWGDNVRVLRCPRYREADRLWRVGTRLEVTFSVAADQRHRRARL